MRTVSGLSIVFFLALTPVVVLGADEIIQQKVVDIARDDNQVMDHLDHLVNGIGARLTASYKDHQACEWAVEKFKEWGYENARMEKAGEFAVAFNRGPWAGKMIAPEEMVLEFGTPAWSAGTKGAVQGPAKMAPKEIEGANAADYDGAWVLMPAQQRRGNREAREKQRAITDFLREASIAGFIYGTRDKYIRTGGNSRLKWENLPTTPRINLMRDHYDAVAERIDDGQEVTLQFDIRNHFVKGPAPYYNVIADLVGSEFPDEYVVIGGHIDSWDGATGTTDDGMGCATTMEAARLLMKSGAQPRRTIRFMLWSGEEQGLLGSRGYVDKNPEAVQNTSACIVYDGGPNYISGIKATPTMMKDFEEVFGPIAKLDEKYSFKIEEVQGLPSGPGSDHLSFLGKNVPGFFWEQETGDPKGTANWRHGIHTQFDTYDLAIPEYLEHSAVVVALSAIGLADLDGLLSRENLKARRNQRGGGGRRMGVQLDDVTISEVIKGSVAAKAGLKAGDQIMKVDGAAVENRMGLLRAVMSGGGKKTFTVKRGGKDVDVILEWEEEKPKKKQIVL